jgi:hypothetical protein
MAGGLTNVEIAGKLDLPAKTISNTCRIIKKAQHSPVSRHHTVGNQMRSDRALTLRHGGIAHYQGL